MKALKSIYDRLNKKLPQLINYKISIPPGGRTDAFVETIITWELEGNQFKTRGFEPDQQAAAITATIKMLNLMEDRSALKPMSVIEERNRIFQQSAT
jgi:(R)-citramalate synthase